MDAIVLSDSKRCPTPWIPVLLPPRARFVFWPGPVVCMLHEDFVIRSGRYGGESISRVGREMAAGLDSCCLKELLNIKT